MSSYTITFTASYAGGLLIIIVYIYECPILVLIP